LLSVGHDISFGKQVEGCCYDYEQVQELHSLYGSAKTSARPSARNQDEAHCAQETDARFNAQEVPDEVTTWSTQAGHHEG
jgi:hypothetical protein